MVILNDGHIEDSPAYVFILSYALCSTSPECIYQSQAFVSRLNQTFVKYWNLDLRLMRAYTCLNLDVCIEDVY